MAFPTSPTDGQIAVQNGITYTYASATTSWTRTPTALPTLSVYTDTFVGDGATITYTLSVTPKNKDYISINIDGVSQLKSAYNLSNNIVTFTGIPDDGAIIEVKSWNATTSSAITGLVFDTFTGDGTTVAFTLSASPTSTPYTLVTIGGIVQQKVNYSVSGTTLTFSTAPPNTTPIEVITFGPAITQYTSIPAGNTTEIQINSSGVMSSSSNLTFSASTNTLSTTNFTASGNVSTGNLTVAKITSSGNIDAGTYNIIGNGYALTNINSANITGTIASATTAGTVTTAAQPNITSVGTLSSLTVTGNSTFNGWMFVQQTAEVFTTKTGSTGTVTYDLTSGTTFYHTSPAANWTANLTNVPAVDGRAIVVGMIVVQGSTGYLPTTVQIDGVAQTIKWYNVTAPAGTASKIDIVSYSLFRVSGSWTILGQYVTYG